MKWSEAKTRSVVANRRRLDVLSKVLLNADSWPGQRLKATQDLRALFAELTGIDDHSGHCEDERESRLKCGTAISPRDAARCVLDLARTTKFLRGIEAGIRQLFERFPGHPVDVLYAGCGPYAALAVPLCSRFSPGQVRFTLIDVHARSLEPSQALIEKLGFECLVGDYVQADAATWQHPSSKSYHLVIVETLQRALMKEPQRAITANLAPQLTTNGIIIPQSISVELCLADTSKEFDLVPADKDGATARKHEDRDRIAVKRLLEVSLKTITELMDSVRDDPSSNDKLLPATMVSIPPLPPDSLYSAVLLTRIEVFNSIVLDDYESGLTYPVVLHDLDRLRGGEMVEFQYRMGVNPGFDYCVRQRRNNFSR